MKKGQWAGWSFEPVYEAELEILSVIEKSSFSRPWSKISFLQELTCDSSWNYALKYNGSSHPSDHRSPIIAGYICFRMILEEMHVFRIAVDEKWRRKGIAHWMLAKCIGKATGMGAVEAILEVRSSNGPALRLYEKNGFCIAGKRPDYYPETREDALILKKTVRRHS